MPAQLRVEEIYEAATDSELFAGLTSRLADSVGARSGVLHWRPYDGDHEEVSYSGYFTPEQMQIYAEHHAGDDLWSAAFTHPSVKNRVLVLDELVPAERYEKGRLYNEWIRPMGDDSYHALGGSLDLGPITAELGFHRGRCQPAFGAAEVQALTEYVDHLQRMLRIRYRLWQAEHAQSALAQAQDGIGYGILTLSSRGTVLQSNRTAERILQRGDALTIRGGCVVPVAPGDRERFSAVLARSKAGRWAGALRLNRRGGGHYVVSALSALAGGERRMLLVISDPQQRDPSLVDRLRMLYGLSGSEADVAIGLAEGGSPACLAAQRETSLETVRNQIKAVSAKLGCSRQAEIVALVAGLPRLDFPLN